MRYMFIIFFIVASSVSMAAAKKKNEPAPNLGTTSIIKCVLTQKLVSDYTGEFRGYVSHDVYDRHFNEILIPKGSKVLGKVIRAGNVNEPINARVAYLIQMIERADGTIIDMTQDSAVDHEGVGAIKDQVNNHFLAQFLGVIAYAIVGSGTDGTQTGGIDGNVDYNAEVKRSLRRQVEPYATKYLRLVPTITIRSGQTFNVFVVKPKYIKPFRGVFHDFTQN